MPSSRILVTGGCGFIGSHVVKLLAGAGARVTVLDTMDAYAFDYAERFGVTAHAAEIVHGDAADAELVGGLVSRADAVVHAAACADVAATNREPARDFAAGVASLQTVLEAVRRAGVERLLFTSSAQVYGEATPPSGVFAEPDAPGPPGSFYANSKYWGEQQIRLYRELHGLRATVLRFFSVYGPGQVPKEGSHSWAVAAFAMRAVKGRPLVVHGDGSQVRDFVYVEDVAHAVVRALTTPAAEGQTMNVGTGTATSIARLAQLVAERVPGTAIERGPRPAGDPEGAAATVKLLERTLGWRPDTSLGAGLDRYLAWVRDNQDLVPSWV
ncbi:NAD-dependent epimerase/dehydratase family protein [Nonomuraea sp. SYSU D8015]|uniref:NAD-dependent epimerase/dehydratase family protein n=1 Tax=Nonomuraea sp. SYSU D8015 TaxID=2593644 RepID=UPI0016606F85|nr:NAD-dependent epimerase/dehydratase family protein [Nonomuraea sp. SYSU D8015]